MPEFMLKISPVLKKEIHETSIISANYVATGFYSVSLVMKNGQRLITVSDDFTAKA
ncbi:hypothetical protein [Christiangramia fulva]|uniref:hypothetical protein n=1 Tax=Christiangramia fulva TaxID=2126553 RepID=UPI00131D5524|nr:hypothetical protein [Christiangramia fulva]